MKKFFTKNTIYKGYSLIELLVVLSIIGVLLSLAVAGISQVRIAQRDGVRLNDLSQLKSKLEAYYGQYNRFPVATGSEIQISADGSQISLYNGSAFYDTVKITQAGLSSSFSRDENSFCTQRATADTWNVLYVTGSTSRPQVYDLKACLETGKSVNYGYGN